MRKTLCAAIALLSALPFCSKAQTWSGSTPGSIYYNFGSVGIGTTTPGANLDVPGTARLGDLYIANDYFTPNTTNNSLVLRGNTSGGVLINYASGSGGMAVYNGSTTYVAGIGSNGDGYFAGKVGIGTTTPDQLLSVNGTIHSKEIKVDVVNLPDYVFKPAYSLPKLADVKAYIDRHQHLPEVPSAQEAEENGLNLGEMNKLLLKKVEELTLYLLEQDKAKMKQEQRISNLEKQIQTLKKH